MNIIDFREQLIDYYADRPLIHLRNARIDEEAVKAQLGGMVKQ